MPIAEFVRKNARRPLRKLRVATSFLRMIGSIAVSPSASGVRIVQGAWPYGLGPKLFMGIGIAIFLFVMNSVQPELMGVSWIEPLEDLTAEDAVKFLDSFGIQVDAFERFSTLEDLRPGSSPMSIKVREHAHSLSTEDVAIFLATRDLQLAERYQAAARKLRGQFNILSKLLKEIVLPFSMVAGGLAYHYTVRPAGVAVGTSLHLTEYFIGYYAVAFGGYQAISTLIEEKIFDPTIMRDRYISNLITLALELIVVTVLTFQFYRFFNSVHKVSRWRAFFGIVVGTIASFLLILLLTAIGSGVLVFVDEISTRFR